MIAQYRYCGISDTKRIWGAFYWVEGGYTEQWLLWGSAKSPQFKRYKSSGRTPRKSTVNYRILDKRKAWSGYTEISEKDIPQILPQLDGQISMHMLLRKLKNV